MLRFFEIFWLWLLQLSEKVCLPSKGEVIDEDTGDGGPDEGPEGEGCRPE
jgi:hypothetical protein